MNRTIVLVVLMAVVTLPAAAQFRESVPQARPSARLYQASGVLGSVISKVFNPSVFKMTHGIEMSAGSFGGRGYSMGMYTNTMAWQFSEKFAMRADVAVAYTPQNQALTSMGFERAGPKVFLRNAEVAWRPSEKFQLNIQVRQDPYGYRNPFMSPYRGRYGLGYYGFAGGPFWHDRWR